MGVSKLEDKTNKNFSAILAYQICEIINRSINKNDYELTKMRIGMEMTLNNLSKLIIICGLSIYLGTYIETGVVFFTFALLRRHTHGLHAKSSLICLLIMCVTHIWLPMLIKELYIPRIVVTGFFFILLFALYQYAPSDTEKLPLINEKRRRGLKIKSVLFGWIIMCIALLVPYQNIRNILLLSTMYVVVMIMPITYIIFKERRNNYKYYE
jgi:accessory gene regulator B